MQDWRSKIKGDNIFKMQDAVIQFLREMVEYLSMHLVSIVFTIIKGGLVWLIGWRLAKFIVKLIRNSKSFQRLDDGIETFLGSLIDILLKVAVILSVIAVLGINLSAAVTALASVGLTFGLAFQGALSNFAGGFIILVFKPFKVGDYIDTHSDSGTVESIAIFHTRLRTPDNKMISIPNGALSNASIINYSALPERRLDFNINVDYNSDLMLVKQTLTEIAEAQPTRIEDKPIVCELNSFGDSSLDFVLRFWVKSSDYWPTRFKVNGEINQTFREKGIVIPFPQLDVHQK